MMRRSEVPETKRGTSLIPLLRLLTHLGHVNHAGHVYGSGDGSGDGAFTYLQWFS